MNNQNLDEALREMQDTAARICVMARDLLDELGSARDGLRAPDGTAAAEELAREAAEDPPAAQYGLAPGPGGPPPQKAEWVGTDGQGEMWSFGGHDPD